MFLILGSWVLNVYWTFILVLAWLLTPSPNLWNFNISFMLFHVHLETLKSLDLSMWCAISHVLLFSIVFLNPVAKSYGWLRSSCMGLMQSFYDLKNVCVCVCVPYCACKYHEEQKALEPLELELLGMLSYLIQILELKMILSKSCKCS